MLGYDFTFAIIVEAYREFFKAQTHYYFHRYFAGTDCTDEVLEIHSHHAMQMMQPYMIGELVREKDEMATVGAVEHEENRKLNSCCPFILSIDKPVFDKEPEALNLCKR